MKFARDTTSPADPDLLKATLDDAYYLDETASVRAHLAQITLSDTAQARIRQTARTLVEGARAQKSRFGGLDKFLNEFGLTTTEGIALMCLAEALLRIPDAGTADQLIRDKIGGADWRRHLGQADDLFVNASTWALMLTGKVIGDVEKKSLSLLNAPGKLLARLSEPVVRQAVLQAMKILGQQFVMGTTIEDALARGALLGRQGYTCSYDMLGEGARTAEDAERYFKSYADAIDAIGKFAGGRGPYMSPGISIKLSALHPRYEHAQRERCVPALSEKLLALAEKCARHNIGMTVDAEEASRLRLSLDIIENAFSSPTLKGWEGFGLAVQAYQKRCGAAIDYLAALADKHDRRMMVRLVKGAYWDSEVKYAQVNGLPGYPVFTRKHATDVAYLANAVKLMSRRDVFYPMFATHNAYTIGAIIELAAGQENFEFQRLHGMGEPLYQQIVGNNEGKYPCRIYAPVGSHQDLLPYLVRRLLENGANTNFVNRLQNEKVPVEDILIDPVTYMKKLDSMPHPKIPQPSALYEDRRNSAGVEFANTQTTEALLKKVEAFASKKYAAGPLIGGAVPAPQSRETPVLDPTDNRRVIGAVAQATAEDMERALARAHAAFPAWKKTPAETRAACLDRAADLMEQNMPELIALCVREAGKTLPDAVAEIREAVDFCRYYAAEGRKHFSAGQKLPGPTGESNELFLEGRGVFLCISPWNFPLAIFMGQVAAALMAGNTVLAKPAGQTCLIAFRAVELLLAAGVPKDALALLPASGKTVGERLVPDARIAGVCMTGSTETAQIINRTLAARPGAIVPLIAETGGQNAMIADSSALPEQIVDDVITSAFRSAGQRCSALRVLFVQDVIADKVVALLHGACKQLTLGDPLKLSTDIGPVIDTAARAGLNAHAARMSNEGTLIAEVETPVETGNGTFFAPRAYEIKSLAQLEKEVFGPILHVIRYKGSALDDVVAQINATGFGLTFGLHTRIDHTARDLTARINAGNCYVNRSMIGAVVGVQPFGGMGLSGTGPKAGGPHYLLRFATERTVTINTTASGGNTTLVSLGEE